MPDVPPARLRQVETDELTPDERSAIRVLLETAFAADADGPFAGSDWEHALGGCHVIAERDGRIVAHASVVERDIRVSDRPLRTGYVEAVATAPWEQGRGLGTQVMEAVGAHLVERFELGVLATGAHGFYERLGWRTWAGPSFVRLPGGLQPTPDEDGFIMVLRTPSTPELDATAPISCDWRSGDVW
jgi:aminoglycoside 2'-N-acetyltransferase I